MAKTRFVIGFLVVMMVLTMVAGIAFARQEETGRGGPSGRHFTLNILGKAWDDKDLIEDCDQGHRIFVNLGPSVKNSKGKGGKSSLSKITEINLIKGDDFQVLDCDGTGDNNPAAFQLPDPDPNDGSKCTTYSVWIRALGKPGGAADVNLCVTYNDPCDFVWSGCSNEVVNLTRNKGKVAKFVDVSQELLTICVPVCVDVNDTDPNICDEVVWERKYLFDETLEGQYWKYNNKGLRHAQIRFYYEPSCISEADWQCEQLGVPPEWQ